MQTRESVLKEWLNQQLAQPDFTLTPLAGDASFRRYYRLRTQNQERILMDAPPPHEALEPFIHVQTALHQAGLAVPAIHAVEAEQGFLILDDLGDQLLLNALTRSNADRYYQQAMAMIQDMQSIRAELPRFDKPFMLKEMGLFEDWFLKAYLGLTLSDQEREIITGSLDWIAEEVSRQPQVFIHRDYHSRNLMLMNDKLVIIDFQDAMIGPASYDLVSLLKDCYIAWPRDQVLSWARLFYQANPHFQGWSEEAFIRAFDLCGLQRHLKVLGIFCRLYLRDQKPGYLKDLPLTLSYALACAESYPELEGLYQFLQQRVRLP